MSALHLLQAEHLARMKRLPSLDELCDGKRARPKPTGDVHDFAAALLGRYDPLIKVTSDGG